MLQHELLGTAFHARLRIDGIIAKGSFGVVLRAHQLAVGRNVAVKVLHDGFALAPEPRRLFRDEIRAIGTIDHRNVVRIFDADETADGRLYFVMELLEGLTLQHLAENGPIPVPRALTLVRQLLDGLAAVHAAGHIHADVKPSNVIVCGAGFDERVVLIDFGLSRVRHANEPAEAVGGTRAYMAPEQLRDWQVDARSDVFSAALVLVKLLTGWQRTDEALVPALSTIRDPALQRALERALAEDPRDRPSAADFARALCGGAPDEHSEPGPPPPFRELAPLTEVDRGRLRGREADVVRIARRIESSSAVVLTAPSGTGKTSLLRAGLVPYLDAAGIACAYVSCEREATVSAAAAIAEGATTLEAALAQREGSSDQLVVILDQLEVALAPGGDGAALLGLLLEGAAGANIAVVLGVREDFVARLLASTGALANGVPQVRIRPLDPAAARAAIVEPLEEHGISITPRLLDRIVDDLVRAGRDLGIDMGWGEEPAVYPPHLQLAGAALFDALELHERTVELTHYDRIGGFAAIVGEHLERTLGELSATDREIARQLFLALMASGQTRAIRAEADLIAMVRARHDEVAVRAVLAHVEARRLVARTTGFDGSASWTLVHDTLLPRIETWVTVHDLDRRRVAEVLRFHLRQSHAETPAILNDRELRALTRFPGLLEELESEWQQRAPTAWTPRALVQRSTQVQRYRRTLFATGALTVLALASLLVVRWVHENRLRERERELRDLNLGRIDLTIEPFDWEIEPATRSMRRIAVDPSALPELSWRLFDPSTEDPDAPGRQIVAPRVRRGVPRDGSGSRLESGIEVRGGDAFLVVSGRGRVGEACPPSVVPLRRLPGQDRYSTPRSLHVLIPTCRATWLDMVNVPAGPFVAAGLGDPPAHFKVTDLPAEHIATLPAFRIDRTEVTNAEFAVFAEMSTVHEIDAPDLPEALDVARGAAYAVSDLDWFEARAYCQFLGKDLPTSLQWQKALRGGLTLGGASNPAPRRNLPWNTERPRAWEAARIPEDTEMPAGGTAFGQAADRRHPAPAGSYPNDRSPYGVLDLAGNEQEWTLDVEPDRDEVPWRRRARITRGGNWFDTSATALRDYMAIQNPRPPRTRLAFLGVRCALTELDVHGASAGKD